MQTILKTLYVYTLIKPNLCCSSGSWWSWNSAVGMDRRERLSWAILFLPVVTDVEKKHISDHSYSLLHVQPQQITEVHV